MGIQFVCSDRKAYNKILSELCMNNNEAALSAIAEGINPSEVSNIDVSGIECSLYDFMIIVFLDYTE